MDKLTKSLVETVRQITEASQAQINASPVHHLTASAGKYLAMRLDTPDKAGHYTQTIHGVVGPNPKLETVVNTARDHVVAGNPAVEKLLYRSHAHGHRHMTVDKSEDQLVDDLHGHLERLTEQAETPEPPKSRWISIPPETPPVSATPSGAEGAEWVHVHSNSPGAPKDMNTGYDIGGMHKILKDLGVKDVNTAMGKMGEANPRDGGTRTFSVGGKRIQVEYGQDSAGRGAMMRWRVFGGEATKPPVTPPAPVAKAATTAERAVETPKKLPEWLAKSPWAKEGGKFARALGPLGVALGALGVATGEAKAEDVVAGLHPLSVFDSGSLGTEDVPAEVRGQNVFTPPKPPPQPQPGPADEFVYGRGKPTMFSEKK